MSETIKKLFLFSIWFLATNILYSQSTLRTFVKSFGGVLDESESSVIQTADSGFLVLASTLSFGTGEGDVYLTKFDKNISLTWSKTYGGNLNENPKKVIRTNDNGYLICCATYSFGITNANIFVIKIDHKGDTLWTRMFGTTSGDEACEDVIQDSYGDFIIMGSRAESGINGFYAIKISNSGNLIWGKVYSYLNNIENGTRVFQAKDSGYYLVGYGAENPKYSGVIIIKTTKTGDVEWSKKFHSFPYPIYAYSAYKDSDDNIFIAGDAGNNGVFVKINSKGEFNWGKNFGNNQGGQTALDIIRKANGDLAIAGITFNKKLDQNFFLLLADNTGSLISFNVYGEEKVDLLGKVIETYDGGLMLSGMTGSFGSGKGDILLMKTNNNGKAGCMYAKDTTIMYNYVLADSFIKMDVYNFGEQYNPHTFLTNSDGQITTMCSSNSANVSNVQSGNLFKVYPNPTQREFTIYLNGEKSEITIFDIIGRQLQSFISHEETLTLTIENNGIFYVHIKTEEGLYVAKLMVK